MKIKSLVSTVCISLCIISFKANGSLVQYSGTSLANYTSGPVSQISLTWSAFAFDDSQVTGVGTEFFDLGLSSLSFSPDPLGTTTFTTANTGFQLHYVSGSLFALRVGGLADGVENILGGSDDFFARYTPAGEAFQTVYRLGTSSAIDGNSFDMTATVTATVSPVPVPAAVWLFGTGLIGLIGVAKRKKVAL